MPDAVATRADAFPTVSRGLPSGDYAYEIKWDGFRAIVSTNEGYESEADGAGT
jgi:ATP-dependent DNA ligase